LAAAAALTTSAGATNRGNAKIDLSTRGGVATYLASKGVSIKGIVIQRGAHNYAGPSCPGKGWTCTTAKRVLQIASGNGNANVFTCTGGTSSGPGDCTIFQSAGGSASNSAKCYETASDALVDQFCNITQRINPGGTGSNTALIQQQVSTSTGTTQHAHQFGQVDQTSGSGSNTIQISQNATQSATGTDASGLQQQDIHQEASVTQFSTTGANSAQVQQSQSLKGDAKGTGSINQLQNTDGTVNSNAGFDQESTSGSNTASLNQDNWYDAHVGKAATAHQQQGSHDVSGEAVAFYQMSTGLDTVQSQQTEHQDLHAENVGTLTQEQYGPQWVDPNQGTNPNDRFNANQDSHQNASSPTNQEDKQFILCDTDGTCNVSQNIHQENVSQGNSCTGTGYCDVNNTVVNGVGNNCSAGPDSDGCQTVFAPFPPGDSG
jgi:hypothetical protein